MNLKQFNIAFSNREDFEIEVNDKVDRLETSFSNAVTGFSRQDTPSDDFRVFAVSCYGKLLVESYVYSKIMNKEVDIYLVKFSGWRHEDIKVWRKFDGFQKTIIPLKKTRREQERYNKYIRSSDLFEEFNNTYAEGPFRCWTPEECDESCGDTIDVCYQDLKDRAKEALDRRTEEKK